MPKILHLSDIHFGALSGRIAKLLNTFVDQLNLDLIVISGDLTQHGRRREFRSAAKWVARFDTPVIMVPGNHDTPIINLPVRLFQPFKRYRRHLDIEEDQAVVRGEFFEAVRINSARGVQRRIHWGEGIIDLHALRKGLSEFSAEQGLLRLLVVHHPLVEPEESPVRVRTVRGRRAARACAAAGVDLVLSGHIHIGTSLRLPFGDEMTHQVTAPTLSKRGRGKHPGFNVIEVETGKANVLTYEMRGRTFDVLSTSQLPLRSRVRTRAVAQAVENPL